MTPDEIVKALKLCAGDRCCEGCIEEQSVRHWQIVMQEAADLIESLQANLAASQRRERAAVEDFEGYMKNRSERCAYCIHDDECEPGESLCYANVCGFEWRGPQEAGEGEHV